MEKSETMRSEERAGWERRRQRDELAAEAALEHIWDCRGGKIKKECYSAVLNRVLSMRGT